MSVGNILPGSAPNLGDLLTPIQPTSISFEQIAADLKAWALAKPDGVAWSSWFTTDDGTIISEWIAGLAVFRKLAETMRQREASLDFAQLESSIYELAFNRGLLVAPAAAPILLLNLTTTRQVSVNVGDLVGIQGTYELYSLEGKTLASTDTLRVAVGHQNVYTPSFSTLGKFTMFEVPLADRYVAAELENLVADGTSIALVAEPNNLGGFANNFLLRRVLPSQVRIYVGNGSMGWWSDTVAHMTYTCLSYGRDVVTNLAITPTVSINASLTGFTIVQQPSFDPDAETLRAISRYYPIDGRIVQDQDYEATIRKYYGGVVYDVIAYNSDPDENIVLLAKPEFGAGTNQGNQLLAQIETLVDSKRMLNIPVHYTVVSPSAGLTFAIVMAVPAGTYSFALQSAINDVLATQLNVFARATTTITALNIATQLSARFGVNFRPVDPTASITLGPTDFLASFTVGLVTG